MLNGKFLFSLVTMSLLALPSIVCAQDYYDDDIYFNADKAPKIVTTKKNKNTGNNYIPNTVYNYPGSDSYIVNTGNLRDVDEYNRRGQFLVQDSVAPDSAVNDNFYYTRQIERFSNPDIVTGSNDAQLKDYYYAPAQELNIYVNAYPTWTSPYWYSASPYWYSSWYWPSYNWAWTWGYDPYWSLSWGWGPSWYPGYWRPGWNWGWNWGWTPGWGPGWGPGHGHGPGHIPGPSYRPNTSPGASNTHRPAYAGGSSTTGGNRRPGTTTTTSGNTYAPGSSTVTRPGNMGRGRYNDFSTPTNPQRPGSANSVTRPATSTTQTSSGSSYKTTPSTSTSRGRSSYSTPSSSSSSRSSYSTPSSSGRSSGSSYSGGASGTHRSSGGGSTSGGGSGRGRR